MSDSQSLKRQVLDLNDRFWIVNMMEMFERLAYYGVRAVVAIYMVLPVEQGGPEFTHIQKGTIFAWWAGVQSFLPMFTGGFADRYGHKRTVAVAIVIKIVGYLLMATQLSYQGFFLGCMFLAAGTAIFKPGVQGTLAATLKETNASVGWSIFYQLVNIGGFLGPILAGVLRNEFSWAWVFYSCAIIVSVNFLWLPFYKDPTQDSKVTEKSQRAGWAALSQFITPALAQANLLFWGLLTVTAAVSKVLGFVDGWGLVLGAGFFFLCFAVFTRSKGSYDQGRTDPLSVLVVSTVGIFRPRVLFFCLAFAGFWLMFNQVFDLLPNVIDDWVDTSAMIGLLGAAFGIAVVPPFLATLLGLLFGTVCAVVVLLATRPDRQSISELSTPPYAVVGMALLAALWIPLEHLIPNGWVLNLGPVALGNTLVSLSIAVMLVVVLVGLAQHLRIPGYPLALGTGLLGGGFAIGAINATLASSAPTLVQMAKDGAQVNPEWIINLNPGLIVFTVVFFGYLSSFVRPLTSILGGMIIATVGSVLAGTAAIGWSCMAGILVFSVGEMLSSPKKMEYLATLAPKGQEGLFMGYANVPVAIGWITGSLLAGSAYERMGDKVNIARRHLTEVLQVPQATVDALQKSEVVPFLQDRLGMGSGLELQRFLFETYKPWTLWLQIGAIGLASILLMFVYDRVLRRIDSANT